MCLAEIWHTDYYLDYCFYFYINKILHLSPVSPNSNMRWSNDDDGGQMLMQTVFQHSLPLCQHSALAFCILNRLVSSLTPWSVRLQLASSATCHTAKLAKGKALHLPQCRLISAVLSGTDRSTLHCPQRGGPTHLSLEREGESRQRQKEGVKQGEINKERSKNMITFGFFMCCFDGDEPFHGRYV